MERNISILLNDYLRKDFITDALANLPMLILDIYRGFPSFDHAAFNNEYDTLFMICMLLKIFRIFNLDQIKKTLNRIRDMLGDFFYMHKHTIDIIYSWIIVFIYFIFTVHWFACGWLLLHNFKFHHGMRTADFSSEDMSMEYVDSVYFMTTTISKVGYGDANFKGFIDG